MAAEPERQGATDAPSTDLPMGSTRAHSIHRRKERLSPRVAFVFEWRQELWPDARSLWIALGAESARGPLAPDPPSASGVWFEYRRTEDDEVWGSVRTADGYPCGASEICLDESPPWLDLMLSETELLVLAASELIFQEHQHQSGEPNWIEHVLESAAEEGELLAARVPIHEGF